MPINVTVKDPHAWVVGFEAQHHVAVVQAGAAVISVTCWNRVHIALHRTGELQRHVARLEIRERRRAAADDPRRVRVQVHRVLLVHVVDQHHFDLVAVRNCASVGVRGEFGCI